MREEISQEVLFNRQVNYLIIEKLWEFLNKGADKKKFYDLMGVNKNAYCRIRTADTYNLVDLERRWDEKNSALKKIGLSREIMVGIEQIEIRDISQKDWGEYIKYRYEDKKPSSYRTTVMQNINRKLKFTFENMKADKKDKSDIGKILYYFTYGRASDADMPDRELIDLRDSLKMVSVDKMKVCDKSLQKEVYELLKERYRQLDVIIKYDELM